MHPPRGGWGTTRLCTLRTWGETPTQTRQANEPEALGGVSSLQGLTLNGTPFLQGDPLEPQVRVKANGRPGTLPGGGGCEQQGVLSLTAAAVIGTRASIFMSRLCTSVYFPGGGGPCFQGCSSS